MDIMVILQIIVLLGAIFVGVRLGGIGIGYAGGAGVLILGLCLGMKPGNIPWDVILIIARDLGHFRHAARRRLGLPRLHR